MVNKATEKYPHYRARSIREAAEDHAAYEDFTAQPSELLEAILADARHYADKHGLDFACVDRAAYQQYLRDKTL